MAYKAEKAVKALTEYMGGSIGEPIKDTAGRGFIRDGSVIFVYPLVHPQHGNRTYFDTRDSGAPQRRIAWEYAVDNGLKFFCFGLNNDVPKFDGYIFSLEYPEPEIERLSGTINGKRAPKNEFGGNQIAVPNAFVPSKPIERIENSTGVFITVLRKDEVLPYMNQYDNRIYLATFKNRQPVRVSLPVYHTGILPGIRRNVIVFGAPGTGKSWTVEQERLSLLKGTEENYERVTFYPDYTYASFVGSYKPVPFEDRDGDTSVTYEFVPGPFLRIYAAAIKSGRSQNPEPFLLVIEEINRANAASVFGDVFQILDRDDEYVSEYTIQTSEEMRRFLSSELGGNPSDWKNIRLPDNLFIRATMNSADQGVSMMDTAFKRRWDFTYISVDAGSESIAGKYVKLPSSNGGDYIEWDRLRKSINAFLSSHGVNEDRLIGPYFIYSGLFDTKEISAEEFIKVFKDKIIMYLFEDAGRLCRQDLFRGCGNSWNRYSEICRQFDLNGIGIFHSDIIEGVSDK